MAERLAGKTALITGASSGLGRHFATVLAGAGAHVILCARREQALREVAQVIVDSGGTATSVTVDVTNIHNLALLEDAMRDVDILVNNAGTVHSAAALDQTEAGWDQVLDTNLKAAFSWPRLLQRRCGRMAVAAPSSTYPPYWGCARLAVSYPTPCPKRA